MNKEERIKRLEAQIAANTAELEELKAEPRLERCPEGVFADIGVGDAYYFIDDLGGVWDTQFREGRFDAFRLKIGNCFHMNEAGIKAAEYYRDVMLPRLGVNAGQPYPEDFASLSCIGSNGKINHWAHWQDFTTYRRLFDMGIIVTEDRKDVLRQDFEYRGEK